MVAVECRRGVGAAVDGAVARGAHPVRRSRRPSGRSPTPATRPGRVSLQRVLEIVPGLVSWVLILSPLILSFRFPQIVAWFVLTFDFYWLYKAVVLTGSVCIAFGRVRRTTAADWRTRALALADPAARLAEIDRLVPLIRDPGRRAAPVAASGWPRSVAGASSTGSTASGATSPSFSPGADAPIPDPRRLYHVALVPTYTEPFDKLYETVRALAEADYPRDRLMVAIITRETDLEGQRNVARLRELFGDRFLHFFHILDPLEPGIVVGKSSAMAYGGRWLYREIVRLGFDPADVVVTDLDSDYRVHPQYFGYLTYTFLTDPDRYRRLFQPVPMFHNNLWDTPMPIRLVAVGATHVQMWRSLTPEKLISFSSYAVSLQTVHEVDYWATDAIPEDSRFYWKSFFRYSGQFRAVPLFIPMYGDAVRARSYPRTLVEQYTQIRRWAWGITDIPYYIRNAFAHREISRPAAGPPAHRPVDGPHQLGDRAVRDHLRVEPAAPPQPDVRPDDARPEPAALRGLAADRGVLLPAHPRLRRGADRAAADRPRGASRRATTYLQWLAAAVRRARLQQPAGARRPDPADGGQVPRVPGHREGIAGSRPRAGPDGPAGRRGRAQGPGGGGQDRRLRPGRDDDVDDAGHRRVGHVGRLDVEHVLEEGDRRRERPSRGRCRP